MLSQLRDLDLQLLRLFVTVVECGGFSAAQGELGLSQPSISIQMAKLETRLGYRLCERGKGGFRLTPKGEHLLQSTRRLLVAIESFRNEARGVADKLLGEVRLGLSEALDERVLAQLSDAIRRFRQRNEAVTLELVTTTPAELERQLLQDRLHLAIGYFAGTQAALEHVPLFSEPQGLYCGVGHPVFDDPSASRESLADADQVHHPYRFIADDEPLQASRSSARSEQMDGSLAFILSGQHIGYLPRHIAAPWLERGRLRELLPEELGFDVAFSLTRHRGRRPGEAEEAFAADLLAAFASDASD
ncbi:LysR family transcriptional regulator [Pseudomonas sp. ZM23]|uniref:LysR family transcriptional regulator n=1 Tax=Pseudomonas triclosanedens TaxID=2961893 RepID=A0ABY6ZYC5_9PSED|nr:LysR family transcriptional regulator [Pseudomonas triclosanedens]MCP8465297.1 LysR family transcriptional regulator [Pseudomonas triclosanedens]MCP8470763.1 LysR family transcriptional regulator [Pseudomonas triclosanedens]MCP8476546.1 LysR family transcriptional regulator [Pseudomonas triclosanedens]WAI48948.1 LysR family transcriptional regulator [Pseudomonas triclosanedens]